MSKTKTTVLKRQEDGIAARIGFKLHQAKASTSTKLQPSTSFSVVGHFKDNFSPLCLSK